MTFHTEVWVGKDGDREPFSPLPEFYHESNDISSHREMLLTYFVPKKETEVLFITREVEL